MQLDYKHAKQLEGKMIKFKNQQGEWAIGKVAKARKDGLEIEELSTSKISDGHGIGFYGRRPFFRPFFRPPIFFPFRGFGFFPFFFW